MAKIVTDTGKKTGVRKSDGTLVQRKVYKLQDTDERVTYINTENLKYRKEVLEKELAEVNSLLAQMED